MALERPPPNPMGRRRRASLGRRQVVRRRLLVPPFVGSNPTALDPARQGSSVGQSARLKISRPQVQPLSLAGKTPRRATRCGEMAEWLKAVALKATEPHKGSMGSNPLFSPYDTVFCRNEGSTPFSKKSYLPADIPGAWRKATVASRADRGLAGGVSPSADVQKGHANRVQRVRTALCARMAPAWPCCCWTLSLGGREGRASSRGRGCHLSVAAVASSPSDARKVAGSQTRIYILNKCFSKKKKRSIQEHVPVPLPCYNFFSVSHLDLVRCRGLLQRVHQRVDGERDPCTPDLDTRGLPKNDGRCVPLQDAGSPWHTDPRLLLIPA